MIDVVRGLGKIRNAGCIIFVIIVDFWKDVYSITVQIWLNLMLRIQIDYYLYNFVFRKKLFICSEKRFLKIFDSARVIECTYSFFFNRFCMQWHWEFFKIEWNFPTLIYSMNRNRKLSYLYFLHLLVPMPWSFPAFKVFLKKFLSSIDVQKMKRKSFQL